MPVDALEDPRPLWASHEADRRLTVVETELRGHIRQCDQRAMTAQRLLWFVASITTTVFGILVKIAFHI